MKGMEGIETNQNALFTPKGIVFDFAVILSIPFIPVKEICGFLESLRV